MILVLGMHRSGTSMVSHVLHLLGASISPRLLQRDKWNQGGYWESYRINQVLEHILHAGGSAWFDFCAFPPTTHRQGEAKSVYHMIRSIVDEEIGANALSVIKDPRNCRLVPMWRDLVEDLALDPLVIIPFRDPLAVADSLARRFGFTPLRSCLLWLRHLVDAEFETRAWPRLFLDDQSFLADWREAVQPIFDSGWLDVSKIRLEVCEAVNAAVRMDLRHSAHSIASGDPVPEPRQWFADIYAACRDLAGLKGAPGSDIRFDETRRAFDAILEAIGTNTQQTIERAKTAGVPDFAQLAFDLDGEVLVPYSAHPPHSIVSGVSPVHRTTEPGEGPHLRAETMSQSTSSDEEAVAWAYRLFLDREPEDRAAIDTHIGFASTASLRKSFLDSAEYELRNPGSHRPRWDQMLSNPPLEIEYNPPAEAMRALRLHVERNWTRLGMEAPHWSVLSADIFRPDTISEYEDSFFDSGATDAAVIGSILHRYGLTPRDFPWIFEFGCGIGRVTLHLAKTFERVVACDISRNHLSTGKKRAESTGTRNVEWRQVDSNDFGMFEPIPLWFSRIVLQHNPPPIIALILGRAFELLQPGGLAIFQVPTYADGYSFSAETYLSKMDSISQIEMHCLPQNVIFSLAHDRNCEALEVLEDDSIGAPNWTSHSFVFRKKAGRKRAGPLKQSGAKP